jgi:hypothetical protein
MPSRSSTSTATASGDIVAAYAAGPRVWLSDGKGKWTEASQGLPAPEIHGLYWGIDAKDLNGDGRVDIVSGSQMPPLPEGCGVPGAPACTGGGVEAYLQQPDGTWVFATEGFLPMNALGVAIGDLNNDGKMDVVVVGKRALDEIGGVYGIYTYLGDGTGKWTPVVRPACRRPARSARGVSALPISTRTACSISGSPSATSSRRPGARGRKIQAPIPVPRSAASSAPSGSTRGRTNPGREARLRRAVQRSALSGRASLSTRRRTSRARDHTASPNVERSTRRQRSARHRVRPSR